MNLDLHVKNLAFIVPQDLTKKTLRVRTQYTLKTFRRCRREHMKLRCRY